MRGVNLMLIQSRPTGAGIGNYCFAVDAEGHITDRRVGEALMGLKRICPEGALPRLVSAGGCGAGTYGRCGRGRRTRSSPRRPTGWPAARTAGPEPTPGPGSSVRGPTRSYLQIFVIHRSYPQARFSTWGQVDSSSATWSTNRSGRPVSRLQVRTVACVTSIPLINSLERGIPTRMSV